MLVPVARATPPLYILSLSLCIGMVEGVLVVISVVATAVVTT